MRFWHQSRLQTDIRFRYAPSGTRRQGRLCAIEPCANFCLVSVFNFSVGCFVIYLLFGCYLFVVWLFACISKIIDTVYRVASGIGGRWPTACYLRAVSTKARSVLSRRSRSNTKPIVLNPRFALLMDFVANQVTKRNVSSVEEAIKDVFTAVMTCKDENGVSVAIPFINLPSKLQ